MIIQMLKEPKYKINYNKIKIILQSRINQNKINVKFRIIHSDRVGQNVSISHRYQLTQNCLKIVNTVKHHHLFIIISINTKIHKIGIIITILWPNLHSIANSNNSNRIIILWRVNNKNCMIIMVVMIILMIIMIIAHKIFS